MVGHEADAGASAERRDVLERDVREDPPVTAVASANEQLPHTVGHRAEPAEVHKGVGAFDERLSLAALWEESVSRPVQRLLLVATDEPMSVDRLAPIVHCNVQRMHTGVTKTLTLE